MGEQEERVTQTLVLIKPDGLVKSLTGNILTKLSETRLKIVAAKVVSVSKELAEEHYHQLRSEKGDEIFESVLKYIQGEYHTNRVFALVYEGEDSVRRVREVAGETNPEKAHPNTLRGMYGRINSMTDVFENVIHASDSNENAEREIKLWFSPSEITHRIYDVEETDLSGKDLKWKEESN